MTWRTTVTVASSLAANANNVWDRVVTHDGINHELGPWLKMTVPRGLRDATIDTVPLVEPLGRSWVLLFGLLPVDYDDLCLIEVEERRRFLERSRLGSMKLWEHERTLAQTPSGTVVTDRLTFAPRLLLRILPGSKLVLSSIVRRIFEHRHRRLRSYFGAA